MMYFSSKEKYGWQTSPYYKENVPMFYHKRRHAFLSFRRCFFEGIFLSCKTDKKRRIVMDRNLTLYQLSPERAAKIFDRIDMFNRGRDIQ